MAYGMEHNAADISQKIYLQQAGNSKTKLYKIKVTKLTAQKEIRTKERKKVEKIYALRINKV